MTTPVDLTQSASREAQRPRISSGPWWCENYSPWLGTACFAQCGTRKPCWQPWGKFLASLDSCVTLSFCCSHIAHFLSQMSTWAALLTCVRQTVFILFTKEGIWQDVQWFLQTSWNESCTFSLYMTYAMETAPLAASLCFCGIFT